MMVSILEIFISSQLVLASVPARIEIIQVPGALPPTLEIHNPTIYPVDSPPSFDLPMTYNHRVKHWIQFYQTTSRKWFRTWLERSSKYIPYMQEALKQRGLPQDLAYVAMIESGFSAKAVSQAQAVGYWQFIQPTANRYGLKTTWWLDERKDFVRSTDAAASYLGDLYRQFQSWYLTAAAYNMGETRLRQLIDTYKTNDFWVLASKKKFPKETQEYIPKLLAAMLIAKAPKLYGFRDLSPQSPAEFDTVYAPGGTDLVSLAKYLGVQRQAMETLNPHFLHGFIPDFVSGHDIRIPKGLVLEVSTYIQKYFE